MVRNQFDTFPDQSQSGNAINASHGFRLAIYGRIRPSAFASSHLEPHPIFEVRLFSDPWHNQPANARYTLFLAFAFCFVDSQVSRFRYRIEPFRLITSPCIMPHGHCMGALPHWNEATTHVAIPVVEMRNISRFPRRRAEQGPRITPWFCKKRLHRIRKETNHSRYCLSDPRPREQLAPGSLVLHPLFACLPARFRV